MKLHGKVMKEMGRKLEDMVLEGSWASGWKDLTLKGSELGCPTLFLPERGMEMEAFSGESQDRCLPVLMWSQG